LARDPKHLGAEIGLIAVLHTWGQTLEHHPHVHCVVPGGGLAPDHSRWVPSRPGFFLPVRVLARLFRGKLLNQLRRVHANGDLAFHGALAPLANRAAFQTYLAPLYETDWVVYSKPPFGGPAQVLKYLSRYTHRVAISNRRLVDMKDGRVSFLWRDYAHGSRRKLMTLGATEFIRRFLLHILPKGFVRIRHYGFLANRTRKQNLAVCRELLGAQAPTKSAQPDGTHIEERSQPSILCPVCRLGTMITVLAFEAGELAPCQGATAIDDTS
jgi:hypothetical protein